MASRLQRNRRYPAWIAALMLTLASAPSPASAASTGSFLALSDIHYIATSGEKCHQPGDETDPVLWSAAQAEGKRLIAAFKPAFVLILGDLPSHCPGHPLSEYTAALDGVANMVGTGTRAIYVPGNNNSPLGDYYPFTVNGRTPLDESARWHGSPVLNLPSRDIIDASHLPQGFYSVYAIRGAGNAPSLRVIAFNSNIFHSKYDRYNAATYQNDVNAEFDWLHMQLRDAQARGDKVIIAMHVPPGVDGYKSTSDHVVTMWNRDLDYTGSDPALVKGWVQKTFLTLVADYRPEIVGVLSSHTHMNEIRRLRDCSQPLPKLGTFTALDVGVPSITPDHLNNPSMKLFSYGPGYALTENRTFYASGESGANWDRNVLSFDRQNYPCVACAPGTTLTARIAALDHATTSDSSDALAKMMLTWLTIGAAPSADRQYRLALDVTCEVPN